ncbi:MAG: hypothetical protein RLW62_15635 [Gammaproteobacteria bacterium]
MSDAPVVNLDREAFWHDPYPALARMRAHAPIAMVPELGAVLLTRHADVFACEKNVAVFSSAQPGGLMTQLMGENMMRKDGAAHLSERRQMLPTLAPATVRAHWRARFEQHAHAALDALTGVAAFDLVGDYALPVSANALREITGLTTLTPAEMNAVSQAMIDGCANYAGDAAVFDAAATYDLPRSTAKALAVGAGPHFCAGAAAARCLVAEVALPLLFERRPRLRLAGAVSFGGWAFRGPLALPVRTD